MRRKLNKQNVSRIKNKSGIYKLYGTGKKPIYVGTSKVLRHRLQSYYQKDDFAVNRTKKNLRPNIQSFSVSYQNILNARRMEKRLKQNTRFNFL